MVPVRCSVREAAWATSMAVIHYSTSPTKHIIDTVRCTGVHVADLKRVGSDRHRREVWIASSATDIATIGLLLCMRLLLETRGERVVASVTSAAPRERIRRREHIIEVAALDWSPCMIVQLLLISAGPSKITIVVLVHCIIRCSRLRVARWHDKIVTLLDGASVST